IVKKPEFFKVHWTDAKRDLVEPAKNTASANSTVMNMERRSVFQKRVDSSPLSSSLYYGGQEDMVALLLRQSPFIGKNLDFPAINYGIF
ncbi:hypothetical protein M8C21_010530, partial [Ambrosia artemisiifolia]